MVGAPRTGRVTNRRVALLVGTQEYADTRLRPLTAPADDVEALAGVLRDPAIGDFEVTLLIDRPHYEIERQIEATFAAHGRMLDDVLLLYFSGHGLKGEDGELYLGAPNTSLDQLRSTSVRARFIHDMLRDARPRTKIVLLDCCYGGAFTRGFHAKSDRKVHAAEYFRAGKGVVGLLASDDMQFAYEDQVVGDAHSSSVFTRTLVEGLRSGQADLDQDSEITFDEIATFLEAALHEGGSPQRVIRFALDAHGDILLAKNPATAEEAPTTFYAARAGEWHHHAVTYKLSVQAYYDSNADGYGDFRGLTSRLDYLEWLGINTIWLLPFHASPSSYGAAIDFYSRSGAAIDFYSIQPDVAGRVDLPDVPPHLLDRPEPAGNTLNDVMEFLALAHQRNMRVVADIVIDRTASQSNWFQDARRPESPKHQWFFWSENPEAEDELGGASYRWTFDELAGEYYRHRGSPLEPDLNLENDEVWAHIQAATNFWLDLGFDGIHLVGAEAALRRDNGEVVSRSARFLRHLRSEIEKRGEDSISILLPPDELLKEGGYALEGDEAHAVVDVWLAERLFSAVAREVRTPLEELFTTRLDPPTNLQWWTYLRDENPLSLTSLSDEARDRAYSVYARDPRMALDKGIRRRLGPLTENSRPLQELFFALLLSLPGAPVIYYGDELGMGDNIYTEGTMGLRTPMQWTPDKNAGFSVADPQQLYALPILDPIYGFNVINAESQIRNPSSLVHWLRRLIDVRKQYPVLARGMTTLLRPRNPSLLAFVRQTDQETMICINNLSSRAQATYLDLRTYAGLHPVEIIGRERFPRIVERPYLLTLGAYGVYWFSLHHDEGSSAPRVDGTSTPSPARRGMQR